MKAFIFDTETTDLIINHSMPLAKQPEVIEFYGHSIDLATGEVGTIIDRLFKPSKPIGEKTTQITSITNEMLERAPLFATYASAIQTALETAEAVIAHNLSFDKEMLDIEMERLGLSIAWPAAMLSTVEQTIHYKGFRLSLSDLHMLLFGEKFEGAHRARVDVEALTRCAVELFKRGDL
jgi:DNA polymerase III alpha subunit (gram-positive type)